MKDEKEGFNLLGVDTEDNVYIQSVKSPATIYKMKGNTVVEKTILTDPNFINAYPDKDGVYLVYSDHVIDIAKKDSNSIGYKSENTFLGIFGGFMYLKTPQNKIESVNINAQ